MPFKVKYVLADGTKRNTMENYPVSTNNATRIIPGIIAKIEKQNKEKEKQMA